MQTLRKWETDGQNIKFVLHIQLKTIEGTRRQQNDDVWVTSCVNQGDMSPRSAHFTITF